jgi:hypothetical protein
MAPPARKGLFLLGDLSYPRGVSFFFDILLHLFMAFIAYRELLFDLIVRNDLVLLEIGPEEFVVTVGTKN